MRGRRWGLEGPADGAVTIFTALHPILHGRQAVGAGAGGLGRLWWGEVAGFWVCFWQSIQLGWPSDLCPQ